MKVPVTHRTPLGAWANCTRPSGCGGAFHISGHTPTELAAMPSALLWPLLEMIEPPTAVDGAYRSWHNAAGELHRDFDLPAEIDGDLCAWYRDGNLHRDADRPAIVWFNGSFEWWVAGERHRDGGHPAVVQADGTEQYWVRGELVRHADPS